MCSLRIPAAPSTLQDWNKDVFCSIKKKRNPCWKSPAFALRETLAEWQTTHKDLPLKWLLSMKGFKCSWKMHTTWSYLSLQQLTWRKKKKSNRIQYKRFVWPWNFSTPTLNYRGCIPTIMKKSFHNSSIFLLMILKLLSFNNTELINHSKLCIRH